MSDFDEEKQNKQLEDLHIKVSEPKLKTEKSKDIKKKVKK